ncbi:hypothetical protein PoB_002811200 [Plakobranchus ocellatus]|uniref:Secreted protein n=1 Tax=Plakobranchus ocellatus TaxID=259542 RepID=A0AAV4A3Z7_9GAST|nr:hypothetical protein PoB_002811200 [Plakobranchus ocellatus]
MLLSQRNCLLTFCCVLLSILQMAECRAFVSAKLEYYNSGGDCDPPFLFSLAKCDLIFSLCLDRFSRSVLTSSNHANIIICLV